MGSERQKIDIFLKVLKNFPLEITDAQGLARKENSGLKPQNSARPDAESWAKVVVSNKFYFNQNKRRQANFDFKFINVEII